MASETKHVAFIALSSEVTRAGQFMRLSHPIFISSNVEEDP